MPAHSPESLSPRYAPPSSGDGAPAMTDAHLLAAHHHRKVRALLDEETGIRFESLALFAEPLFAHYDLDATAAFEVRAEGDADEATLAVLEAARVLWAYFSLPQRERTARRDDLATFLLGPDAASDDEADLDALLDAAESHWDLLTPDDIALAEQVDAETLGFDALLNHPAFMVPGEAESASERAYGADRLGEMEARALFAQPLLEREHDPDALDAAMERADEYWTLAQLHGVEHDAYLDVLGEAIALGDDEAARIRGEAEAMTARFRSLFPEQA